MNGSAMRAVLLRRKWRRECEGGCMGRVRPAVLEGFVWEIIRGMAGKLELRFREVPRAIGESVRDEFAEPVPGLRKSIPCRFEPEMLLHRIVVLHRLRSQCLRPR